MLLRIHVYTLAICESGLMISGLVSVIEAAIELLPSTTKPLGWGSSGDSDKSPTCRQESTGPCSEWAWYSI